MIEIWNTEGNKNGVKLENPESSFPSSVFIILL